MPQEAFKRVHFTRQRRLLLDPLFFPFKVKANFNYGISYEIILILIKSQEGYTFIDLAEFLSLM